jgi:hypothetical protein
MAARAQGRKLPSSLNPHEMTMWRRTKTKKRRKELPLATLRPMKTSSRLVTSSASKRGSLLGLAR